MLDFLFWAMVVFVVFLGIEEFREDRRARKERERKHMDMESLNGDGGKE